MSRLSSPIVTKRQGLSLPWSGTRAAIVRIRCISSAVGPGPTSSRGFAERRVSSSERVVVRSFSIMLEIGGGPEVNNRLHKADLVVTSRRDRARAARGERKMVDTPGAEAPSSPDITHVDVSDQRTWLGHPRQLARLFSVEMWERFGFYGMRALLVLYLTKHFLIADYQANGIVGGYLSLVYLTPVIGGWLADYYLGSKRSVKWGALVMAVGYLLLCFGGDQAKPYATIEGQRYEIQVARSGSVLDTKDTKQWLVADGQRLRSTASPTVRSSSSATTARWRKPSPRTIVPARRRALAFLPHADARGLEPDRDRQRLFQAEHLDHRRDALRQGRPAARRGLHDILHGASTSARSAARYSARSSRHGSAGGRVSPSSSSACSSATA